MCLFFSVAIIMCLFFSVAIILYLFFSVARQREIEEKLSMISTPNINDRMRDRNERRRKEEDDRNKEHEKVLLAGKERTSWVSKKRELHIIEMGRIGQFYQV